MDFFYISARIYNLCNRLKYKSNCDIETLLVEINLKKKVVFE